MEHAPIPNFMLLRNESVSALTAGRDLAWLAEVRSGFCQSACSSLAWCILKEVLGYKLGRREKLHFAVGTAWPKQHELF